MMFASAQLAITRIHPDAKLPRKGTEDSIGADVYAYITSATGHSLKTVIPPNTTRAIRTGIVAVAQPPFSIFVCSRSGMAKDKALFVTNAPGVIDPDYRGEVVVLLHNAGTENQWVSHEDRIAQLVLIPIPIPLIIESELDLRKLTSARGEAGFGSTGT